MLLLADEISQVDVVLVEIDKSCHIDSLGPRQQVDLPLARLLKELLCPLARELKIVVRNGYHFGLNVHRHLFHVRVVCLVPAATRVL